MSKAGAAREPSSSRAVPLYIAATTLAAVVSMWWAWDAANPFADPVALITLLVLGVLSMLVRERDVGANITFDGPNFVRTQAHTHLRDAWTRMPGWRLSSLRRSTSESVTPRASIFGSEFSMR